MRFMIPVALLLLPAQVPAQEDVDAPPFYPAEDARRLAYEPIAYMVDDETCERVEGHLLADGSLAGEGKKGALFRLDSPQRPFMRVATRADGVYVARFPASPGEVTLARAYVVDRRSRRYIYGKATVAKCVEGRAEVGLPQSADGGSGI
ncbi:hypothetical protein [Pseudoxanthomonas sp. J35]|uniref:hypothetical protein n=1 Tax=Pseudoxanthomonas sp. J35 TaxID=935852 RepID=UPI00048FC6E9|nr:hypothetical protein [Pseudoxanthomonas sp. J35]